MTYIEQTFQDTFSWKKVWYCWLKFHGGFFVFNWQKGIIGSGNALAPNTWNRWQAATSHYLKKKKKKIAKIYDTAWCHLAVMS